MCVEVAKYKLELKSKDNTYTTYCINGLNNAYYKDIDNKYETFGGVCGLIRTSKYPGYCILCMTYHRHEAGEFEMPNYIVDFSPLYNEQGQMILVEYEHDDICAFIDRGYKDYKTKEWVDSNLTTLNNGSFENFINKD